MLGEVPPTTVSARGAEHLTKCDLLHDDVTGACHGVDPFAPADKIVDYRQHVLIPDAVQVGRELIQPAVGTVGPRRLPRQRPPVLTRPR